MESESGVTEELIQVERPGEGVVMLRLNRPEKRNALNSGLRQAIIDNLAVMAADDDVNVVALTGSIYGSVDPQIEFPIMADLYRQGSAEPRRTHRRAPQLGPGQRYIR